jgi:hypothetical protein
MNDNVSGKGKKILVKISAEGNGIFYQKIDLIEQVFISQDFAPDGSSFPNHILLNLSLPLLRVYDDERVSHLLEIGMKILHRNGTRIHESMAISDIPASDAPHLKRNNLSAKKG